MVVVVVVVLVVVVVVALAGVVVSRTLPVSTFDGLLLASIVDDDVAVDVAFSGESSLISWVQDVVSALLVLLLLVRLLD
jgi:hypothetical protein